MVARLQRDIGKVPPTSKARRADDCTVGMG